MKKILVILLTVALCLGLCACAGGEARENTPTDAAQNAHDERPTVEPVEIKASPDKYTCYVKDYVGKNLAAVGYTSMNGKRMDRYDNGYLHLVLLAADGAYIDVENEVSLQDWKIIGQNLAPNTEIKYTYELDENGSEYDNLVATQSIEEIVLAVAPVGENAVAPEMAAISAAPDRYHFYTRDYVGRNLTQCGYTSMSGRRVDAYGAAYVYLMLVTTNGDYVDLEDEESLKKWVVIAQNQAPNAEVTYAYSLDENGAEYENLVASQTLEEILLTVAPVGEAAEAVSMTPIDMADRYTDHIRDYVGRTLAQCGYTSTAGKRVDAYGNGYVILNLYADDGSFIDLAEESNLKNYVVTSQSVAANTEFSLTYSLDSDGNEYDNLVGSQSISEIDLYLTKQNDYPPTAE